MLINFSVSNFRSFDALEQFSMEAGKTRNFSNRVCRTPGSKILKFKAIYGSNASGKSNLIKAIDFMQRAVVHGIPDNSKSSYCRLKEENVNVPSLFEMQILLNDIRYTYGFKVLLSEGRIINEWLYEQKGLKEKIVFSRQVEDGMFLVDSYVSDPVLKQRLQFNADDIKTDGAILFLRSMNQNKDSLYIENPEVNVYKDLFQWIKYNLSVNQPEAPITQYTHFFNSQGIKAAEDLLSQLDTGISKVIICDEPLEKVMNHFPKGFGLKLLESLNEQRLRSSNDNKKKPAVLVRTQEGNSMYLLELDGDDIICKTLKFNHKNSTVLFSLSDESDGTVRLLDLIEVLLSRAQNRVYIIDEVSRCLHPLLTRQFVQRFLDLAVERNIQLIVTTHETGLMDLELLRQDEIGFVEKRECDGTSKIFGLEEYGARFDKRIRNAYLKGDYSAIPRITT